MRELDSRDPLLFGQELLLFDPVDEAVAIGLRKLPQDLLNRVDFLAADLLLFFRGNKLFEGLDLFNEAEVLLLGTE